VTLMSAWCGRPTFGEPLFDRACDCPAAFEIIKALAARARAISTDHLFPLMVFGGAAAEFSVF